MTRSKPGRKKKTAARTRPPKRRRRKRLTPGQLMWVLQKAKREGYLE